MFSLIEQYVKYPSFIFLIFTMNFTLFFSISLFFIEGMWKIGCSGDFNILELEHLSRQLHPVECIKLLRLMRTPLYEVTENADHKNSPEYCRVRLEEWNRTFPGKENRGARASMETVLDTLGRSDLVNYVKRSGSIHSQVSKPRDKLVERREISKALDFSLRRKDNGKHKKILVSSNSGHAAGIKSHVMIAPANKQVELGAAKSDAAQTTQSFSEKTWPIRWIAFGIFLLLILTIILITALVAIYKSGRFFLDGDKIKNTCDDRCPLTQHFQRPTDIEHGWMTSTTDYTGERWRRDSSVPSSRSPSMIYTSQKKKPTRKVKRYRDEEQQHQQQQTARLDKKHKIKETKMKKKSKKKKKNKIKKQSVKTQLNFRERIASILRKDKPDCKCCRCSFDEGIEGNHEVCSDDYCKQRRILNLTDLYYSPQRESSKKSKKSSINKSKPEEKQQKATSPEITPRARRESQLKQVFLKIKEKSPRWSSDHHDDIDPSCGKLTCDIQKCRRNCLDFDENSSK